MVNINVSVLALEKDELGSLEYSPDIDENSPIEQNYFDIVLLPKKEINKGIIKEEISDYYQIKVNIK